MRPKSRLVERPAFRSGIGKREESRRVSALGFDRHDDPDVTAVALAIVARFLKWTLSERCVVSGKYTGEMMEHGGQMWRVAVQAAHIVAKRGSWAGDFGVVAPLVDLLHRVQENDPDFFTVRCLDPRWLAKRHALKYLSEHPKDRDWLLLHATDGDVLALCREAE